MLSGATIQYHYKDLQALPVVSTAVYSPAIWTKESRHFSSSGSLPLMVQIARQWGCSKPSLDLFVEQEEASVASLLSYSKYIVFSNHHILFAVTDSREGSCWDFVLMIAQSVWAFLECIACLTPAL